MEIFLQIYKESYSLNYGDISPDEYNDDEDVDEEDEFEPDDLDGE